MCSELLLRCDLEGLHLSHDGVEVHRALDDCDILVVQLLSEFLFSNRIKEVCRLIVIIKVAEYLPTLLDNRVIIPCFCEWIKL